MYFMEKSMRPMSSTAWPVCQSEPLKWNSEICRAMTRMGQRTIIPPHPRAPSHVPPLKRPHPAFACASGSRGSSFSFDVGVGVVIAGEDIFESGDLFCFLGGRLGSFAGFAGFEWAGSISPSSLSIAVEGKASQRSCSAGEPEKKIAIGVLRIDV